MEIKELQEKLDNAEKRLSDKEEVEKKILEEAGVDSLEAVMELIKKANSGEVELSEVEEEKKKLEEEKKELKEKLELSEKNLAEEKKLGQFHLMLSEGKVCMAQKDAFIKGDMVEFAKNASTMNLSEKGHGGNPSATSKEDAENKLLEISSKIEKDRGVTFSEALSIARKENKELVKKLNE